MSKQHSVYSNCNPQLSKLFDQVAPTKLLCVALDYAKSAHTALICNGKGDLLKPPFVLENTAAGAEKLMAEAEKCARQERIGREHVFFAGEDEPSFAENFLRALRQRKYLVALPFRGTSQSPQYRRGRRYGFGLRGKTTGDFRKPFKLPRCVPSL